jgi:hypothetical protein
MRQHSTAMAKEVILEFKSDGMGASYPFKMRFDGLCAVEARLCRPLSIRKY